MTDFPRLLRIETGFSQLKGVNPNTRTEIIDYGIYERIPLGWRRIEQVMRLDLILAFHARKISGQFDIIWADSEKVGIPLALLGIKTPIITLCQHIASPKKRRIVKSFGITRKWAGAGYITKASKNFLLDYYKIPANRLIKVVILNIDINKYKPASLVTEGSILSLGVAKRDYRTLIASLKQLPEYETNIHVSSRYNDMYKGDLSESVPDWIRFEGRLSDKDLINRYKQSRFVVVPLENTTQFGAGASVVLEAGALGKAVIATKTQGMTDFVIDGVTGLLVPPHDVEAMRDAIYTLWNNPELAYKMGLEGRKYIENEFNKEQNRHDIKEFIIRIYKTNPHV